MNTATGFAHGSYEELLHLSSKAGGGDLHMATIEVMDTAELVRRWLVDHAVPRGTQRTSATHGADIQTG